MFGIVHHLNNRIYTFVRSSTVKIDEKETFTLEIENMSDTRLTTQTTVCVVVVVELPQAPEDDPQKR